ncbi:MAG: serine kinase [Bacteroidales bacterium]|jgi:predicted transcriptional regulator|nr:DRTGG domain-containing protein [Bacteroidales bacterium]NLK80429.1 serine kinase [Bacteroidales bacterium]HKM30844.1 DRTGG domain-containing protein [Bacteroidales bacterium]HPX78886.1 DRTGG domain-containing protein [Bacteroidales bacterium]HQB24149.1 DRTGG domain-containing protein [Bacteroidales bacterium]
MTVKEMAQTLGLTIFTGEEGLEKEIEGGYTSDLLSDVMGYADAGYVWITLQTHKNVMAVASLKELAAVILVKGFAPDEDTAELARQEQISILGTTEQAFELSGRLYRLLHP